MRKIVRQERLKDDKKARLIEAAIEEFNEHGLQNASYNRIIERSGLNKEAVYYYFENKDALFYTVLKHCNLLIKKKSELQRYFPLYLYLPTPIQKN